MIYYFPLERIDMRYTAFLDDVIMEYLNANLKDFIAIRPGIVSGALPEGMFLDAGFTTRWKSLQISTIANIYKNVTDDDVLFFSDLWFPGIEAIAYLNHFYKVKPKIKGIIHAGSFTDTDEVRYMERWAKGFEDMVFDIADEIFVGSKFIKNDMIQKRLINGDKITVTGLPMDYELMKPYWKDERKHQVLFSARNHPEKQPWLFEQLAKEYPGYVFINTQELKLSKEQYYELLGESKAMVSFALQENFGFAINEAAFLGCFPIVPDRLAYKEFYKHRYKTWEELKTMLDHAMQEADPEVRFYMSNEKILNKWFK